MKIFIILSCAVAATVALSHDDYMWEDWKTKHGKSYYDDKDEAVRRFIWQENLKFVDNHNREFAAGFHTYRVEMNKYADLDGREFKKMFLGAKKQNIVNTAGCENSTSAFSRNGFIIMPDKVDWREKGYVTGVKNQGQCGSCWAFSTTGSLEGQNYKVNGKLVSLSEQNLMDCSHPEGDFSCEGGLMDYAFEYIIKSGGIATEKSYPYLATDERICNTSKAVIGARMKACVDIVPHRDEDALLQKVANIGPISVAIDAGHQSFQLYKDGIYYEPRCSQTVLDHGVLAIGYGTDEDGGAYWLVKNSWGTDWGMDGYLKMSRNRENNCGIATTASYPIAQKEQ